MTTSLTRPDVLTPAELTALTHSCRRCEDGTYLTTIDHDGHEESGCETCDAELAALCASLPAGWTATLTGEGNGTEYDVEIIGPIIEVYAHDCTYHLGVCIHCDECDEPIADLPAEDLS